LGIRFGIEGALAPTRILIPVALVLLAIGPLREAVAERAEPGLHPGEMRIRWAGVIGAGITTAAVTVSAFNPVTAPLNDWGYQPGADRSEIWTMRADGSGQTRLLAALGDGVDFSLPAWSPDGTRIAYTAWTNEGGVRQNIRNSDQTSAIWTMAADGSDRRVVVDGAARDGAQAWIPAWSPDGQWIAFISRRDDKETEVFKMRADGSQQTRLTRTPASDYGVAWSPDGKRLAFVSEEQFNAEIFVMNADGTGVTRVSQGGHYDFLPRWSPDGKRIGFTSGRDGSFGVYAMAPDGSDVVDLSQSPLQHESLWGWLKY
jgi:Tol biopolymer transport system component